MKVFFKIPWDVFPPIVWAVLTPVFVILGVYGLWRFGPSIFRGFWSIMVFLKIRFWKKKVVIPFFVLGCIAFWRAWPLAVIFTGFHLYSSKNFKTLQEHLPPESAPLEIYEGLSHPMFEKEELIDTILFGSRKMIHGHGFQSNQIEPNEVTQAFVEEFWSEHAFRPWIGAKLCGGFHADYCLRWKDEGVRYDVMICLGCGEALLFRDGRALRCDLGVAFHNHLIEVAYPDRR